MSFSLRVCRHCYGALSLDATKCPHCKKATMDPKNYKRVLIGMGVMLGIMAVVLLYAVVVYVRAVALYA